MRVARSCRNASYADDLCSKEDDALRDSICFIYISCFDSYIGGALFKDTVSLLKDSFNVRGRDFLVL